jgi:hypothetical protein
MRRTGLWNLLGLADTFRGHWEDLDAEFGTPFVLPSGMDRATFDTLRDDLAAQGSSVVGDEGQRGFAMNTANRLEREMHPIAVQFNALVRVKFPNASFLAVLDPLPAPDKARSKRIQAYENIERLWETIDANTPPYPGFTPPLVLPNGMDLAAFSTKLADIKSAVEALGDSRQVERRSRAVHRELADRLWAAMVEYRRNVLAVHPDTALALALPRITPRRKKKAKPPVEPPA